MIVGASYHRVERHSFSVPTTAGNMLVGMKLLKTCYHRRFMWITVWAAQKLKARFLYWTVDCVSVLKATSKTLAKPWGDTNRQLWKEYRTPCLNNNWVTAVKWKENDSGRSCLVKYFLRKCIFKHLQLMKLIQKCCISKKFFFLKL